MSCNLWCNQAWVFLPSICTVRLLFSLSSHLTSFTNPGVCLDVWFCSHPSLSSSPPARPHDFFDAQTMDAIRHRAICLNLTTHIESVGNGHSVVFHSTVSLCTASRLPVYVWLGLNTISNQMHFFGLLIGQLLKLTPADIGMFWGSAFIVPCFINHFFISALYMIRSAGLMHAAAVVAVFLCCINADLTPPKV